MDKKIWKDFWAIDNVGSCVSLDSEDPLHKFFASYWHDALISKNKSSSIVDLACGNGFIGNSLDLKNAKLHQYLGVDIAKVSSCNETLSNFKIVSNVDITDAEDYQSHIPKCMADCVVSQFGFEYAKQSDAIKTINYCLSDGGKAQMLVHNNNSVFSCNSRDQISVLQLLLEGLFDNDLLITLFNNINHCKDKQNLSLIQNMCAPLNEVLVKCYDAKPDREALINEYFKPILSMIASLRIPSQCLEKIEISNGVSEILSKLSLSLRILKAQISVAKSNESVNDFVGELKKAGFSNVNAKPFRNNSELLAWEVKAKKS